MMGHGGSAIVVVVVVVVSQAGRWLSHGELSSVPVYSEVPWRARRACLVCCLCFGVCSNQCSAKPVTLCCVLSVVT